MKFFKPHYELQGRHATLSASKYHWIRYDTDKFMSYLKTQMSAQRGTELHALAAELIRLKVKLPKTKQTLSMFVNDALGFRMNSEQVLSYSPNAFGTADAISFRRERRDDERMTLRIHDLKTGTTKSSVNQLEVYAAFFCLEYDQKPHELTIELRIYQNDEVEIYIPDPDDILSIMSTIKTFDDLIVKARAEAEL